jgi:hypothetical protein
MKAPVRAAASTQVGGMHPRLSAVTKMLVDTVCDIIDAEFAAVVLTLMLEFGASAAASGPEYLEPRGAGG